MPLEPFIDDPYGFNVEPIGKPGIYIPYNTIWNHLYAQPNEGVDNHKTNPQTNGNNHTSPQEILVMVKKLQTSVALPDEDRTQETT